MTSSAAALTGAEAQSTPPVILNNALITQRFQSDLLTPDGRLGLGFLDSRTARFRLRALRDPEQGVTNGVPRITVPMQPADDSEPGLYVDVTSPMPSEIPPFPLRHGNPLELRVWTNSGQGSLTLDPRYAPSGKPFPVDEPGYCAVATPANRDSLVSPGGRYECYRLLHFQPFSIVEPYIDADGVPREDLHTLAIYQAELMVAVDARRPGTPALTTARAQRPLIVQAQYTTGFSVSRGQPGNTLLWALESSATADSRLMVAEGGRWSFNETPWNPNTWSSQQGFAQLHDSVRGKLICRHINPTTGQPDCVANDILRSYELFSRVYPVAAQPLFRADGTRALPGQQQCGYTWITPEGTDVFCRPNTEAEAANETFALGLRQSFESSTGMHFFSFGQHTGWMLRRIDGGINTRRFNPEALVHGGPPPPGVADQVERPFSPLFLNTSTGFWAENRTSPEKSLPVQRRWPLFQFMTRNNALTRPDALNRFREVGLVSGALESDMQYWEASFACGVNPDCLLHLPMNELAYDRTGTPDVSGLPPALPSTHDTSNNTDFFGAGSEELVVLPRLNPYVGTLTGTARFVGEVYGAMDDESYLSGYRGTAISLGASGAVRVLSNAAEATETTPCRRNKGCLVGQDFDTGYTAELAFLLLFDPTGATIPLAEQPGLWSMRLQNGALVATVSYKLGGQPQPPLTLSAYGPFPFAYVADVPSVQAPKWRHVALRLSQAERRVTLFVGGVPVAETALPREAKLGVAAPSAGSIELVRVGPAGACTACPASNALFVDELALHKAALPFEELAASGSAFAGRQDFLSPTQARTLFASYFRTTNPRQLSLLPDGFPRFVRPEDLRVPATFGAFLSPGREAAFRQLVSVGTELFSSPVLSTDATGNTQKQQGTQADMSCVTCHQLDKAFTDGRALALGVKDGVLNTPTIFNRALGTRQFFARRASDLMDQALQPVEDPSELNGDVGRILEALNTQPQWASLRQGFANVFGDTPVTREHLAMALTAYQLVQLDVESLADAVIGSGRASHDDEGRLLRPEVLRLGKELFEGKARCSACHVGALFTDELAHDTGVSATPKSFKTPTLWNIEQTGPYFHDGSQPSLRAVLEFYNRGGHPPGRAGDGLRLVDPELRPLALSENELGALETYLRALQNARPVLKDGSERLVFSNHGPIPGMSCVQIHEAADPHGWEDNYLCSVADLGLAWSSAGPLAGMRCTAVNEGAEPQSTTWSDNYVCVSTSSPLQLSWWGAGAPAGQSCVRFYEPADPYAWVDNYLCYEAPPRLVGVLRGNTGSGKVEVHALDGLGEYQSFSQHSATGLPQVANDHSWEFAFGDYNGDGAADLYAIARVGTVSGMTEVNVLSGADDFRTLLTRRPTALGPTGADRSWRFLVADFNGDGVLDLYSITTVTTGSNMTEVHVLNGADGFTTFLDHIPTALGLTGSGSNVEFALADSNLDGKLDLFAITKVNTASGRTEVDVLDGANRFQTLLVPRRQTALGFTGADEAWKFGVVDYNRDGVLDLFGISRVNTGTGMTEIHVLNGADGFSTFLQQRGTALHLTGTDASWTFELK